MLSRQLARFYTSPPCKNVHPPLENEHQALPGQGHILEEVLRSVETNLQQRDLLPGSTAAPIWFLAETERNIFLWRNGLSLSQRDHFEFCFDVPRLIARRLRQLAHDDPENPLLNPLWGQEAHDPAMRLQEQDYLRGFLETLTKIEGHVHALSCVALLLRRERAGGGRPLVTLPEQPPLP